MERDRKSGMTKVIMPLFGDLWIKTHEFRTDVLYRLLTQTIHSFPLFISQHPDQIRSTEQRCCS